MSIVPNLFLVGAPKCGTTAMDHYLKQHPDIWIAHRKEMHFFGSDLTVTFPRPTEREYLKCFDRGSKLPWRGESSVFYMVSTCAAKEIGNYSPDARILIMLRNPVETLHSLHSEFLYRGFEDIEDFAMALSAEPDRAAGRSVPKWTGIHQALLYRHVVSFADQVRRYFDAFGRDRVRVILFDDFRSDTPETYRETLEWLGVDPEFRPSFDVVNPSKRLRSRAIRNLFYNNRLATNFRIRHLIPKRIRDTIRNWNTHVAPREPMNPELRAKLQREMAPGVEQLGVLLGRDLSHWQA